jgi:hypothetical protein
MVAFSEFLKQSEKKCEIENLRNKFHESRSEYELGLRKHLLGEVKNCPCCFKGFFTESKDSVKQRAFYRDFEPDDLDVLEQMFVTPVVFDESHNLINE